MLRLIDLTVTGVVTSPPPASFFSADPWYGQWAVGLLGIRGGGVNDRHIYDNLRVGLASHNEWFYQLAAPLSGHENRHATFHATGRWK